MDKFPYMAQYGYEQLVYFNDSNTGLKAITCVHNTVLGPSLGGTRFWNYKTEEEAAYDVLRLARGMTYKSSLAGLALGGGKTVVIGDPTILKKDPIKREAFWRAFGRYVEGLNGRYITSADMNTGNEELTYIHMETNHVVGLPGRSGSPSPYTARGVFNSIKACAQHTWGSDNLTGKTVAVQGAGGAVGYSLCKLLHEAGAHLVVSDISEEKVAPAVTDFGAKAVVSDEIYGADCDIFAPSAMGAVINEQTIPALKCKIVCGAANNVLAEPARDNQLLADRGIVYAPDYLANAGGVINVFHELATGGYNETASLRDIDTIYHRMLDVLQKAEVAGALTSVTADRLAEERIEAMRGIKTIMTRSNR